LPLYRAHVEELAGFASTSRLNSNQAIAFSCLVGFVHLTVSYPIAAVRPFSSAGRLSALCDGQGAGLAAPATNVRSAFWEPGFAAPPSDRFPPFASPL